MTDYMPDPERTVAYKLLAPGFTKVFVFGHVLGPWPFNDGYIIADSWEDAYEELLDYALEKDGPCDHGDDPELAALVAHATSLQSVMSAEGTAAWEACEEWVDSHCDCSWADGGRVWMVDRWWHAETRIHPYALVKALHELAVVNSYCTPEQLDQLYTLMEWYEPGEDEH
jgi:hypothetical protein